MAGYKTFSIGSGDGADIRLARDGIAYRHAELVIARSGALHLTDCGSEQGSWRREGDEWMPVRQDYVEAETRLRLGGFETTPQALLSMAVTHGKGSGTGGGTGGGHSPSSLPSGRVRRVGETGEVVAIREDS
ncbi:MAG: FHA domain-containing protein [Alphaproteobacteria bacterium]